MTFGLSFNDILNFASVGRGGHYPCMRAHRPKAVVDLEILKGGSSFGLPRPHRVACLMATPLHWQDSR